MPNWSTALSGFVNSSVTTVKVSDKRCHESAIAQLIMDL